MSTTKYIEFTSVRRDRFRYPFPARFIITQSSQKTTEKTALDPVALSMPIFAWTPFSLAPRTGNILLYPGSSPNFLSNTMDNSVIVLKTYMFMQLRKDYYVGACLVITNSNLGTSNTRRIISSQYVNGTPPYSTGFELIVTVSPPFSDSLLIEQDSASCTFSISDPSDISDPYYPQIFVPAGLPQKNAYVDYYLYNERQNDYRKVLAYDETTHLLTLDTVDNPIPPTWNLTIDNLCLRKALPFGEGACSAVSTTEVTIYGASSTDIYTNKFLRMTPFPYYDNTIYGKSEARKIVSYVYNSSVFPTPTATITVAPPFTYTPVAPYFELLQFSYDNVFPFTYNGTDRGSSYYRVDLVNLILPNLILANAGYGGRIAYYPYVYVKVNNISSSGGASNLIMSNNPNANSMTFRCPINDTNYPEKSPFINVYGNGMSQVFQFSPGDDLEFEVTLPNGELFKTEIQDFYSPSEPNYQVQISAIFSLEKIN